MVSLFSACSLILEHVETRTFLFPNWLGCSHYSSAVIESGQMLPELESSVYFAEEGDRNCFCCFFSFLAGRERRMKSQTIFLINLLCYWTQLTTEQRYVRFAACSTCVVSVSQSRWDQKKDESPDVAAAWFAFAGARFPK